MPEPILYGQPIVATMSDLAGEPTIARWRVTPPGSATDTTYTTGVDAEATRPAARTYQLAILPDAVGRWVVRFEGVGDYPDAAELAVEVLPSATRAPALS